MQVNWTFVLTVTDVLIGLATGIGVIASLWLSVKALREVQEDRAQRQRPYLMFEPAPIRLTVQFRKIGRRVPGINPASAERLFSQMPSSAESIDIATRDRDDGKKQPIFYGRLKNYGLGPAISCTVTWVPQLVQIGTEEFLIDDRKLADAPYLRGLNELPTVPGHIEPGVIAELTRLPTFIVKDWEKKIARVEGVLEIRCEDVFGRSHCTLQEFTIFTGYQESPPCVHVVFSDLVPGRSEAAPSRANWLLPLSRQLTRVLSG